MTSIRNKKAVWVRGFFLLTVSVFVMLSTPVYSQTSGAPAAIQQGAKLVIGGGAIKANSKVTISITGNSLQFGTEKATVLVPVSSILNISSNQESRQDVTGKAKLASEALPYGGTEALTLFSHTVDVLTVEYSGENGGYHGVVFVLAHGQAAPIIAQLVALGATSQLPLVAKIQGQPRPADSPNISASSIQIQPIDPGDVAMPPDFRVAIYENLIQQIQKIGKFQHVYRSGDKNAASALDLVTLRATGETFKEGSQKERELIMVAGATSLQLELHITNYAGQTILDRNVKSDVRFVGENLKVTYKFSKQVAGIVKDQI